MADEDNPFDSPRLLLDGARRHIAAFKTKVDELRSSNWGTAIGLPDGSVEMKPTVSIPPEMKQILFDVANNLRSAMDHAVFASAFILTGHEGDGTKFPIGDTAKEAANDAKKRCKHVPSQMVDFLLAFEVHRDGNPILWGLNKLRNTKSHRVLIPIGAVVGLSSVGEPSQGLSATHEWDQATGRLKAQLQLAPGTDGGGVAFSFRLEIAIGTGTFRGEPALGIFDRMLGEVERIVSAIEAETARILASRS